MMRVDLKVGKNEKPPRNFRISCLENKICMLEFKLLEAELLHYLPLNGTKAGIYCLFELSKSSCALYLEFVGIFMRFG